LIGTARRELVRRADALASAARSDDVSDEALGAMVAEFLKVAKALLASSGCVDLALITPTPPERKT
jgi:uncharacterized protein (DUF2252 family)